MERGGAAALPRNRLPSLRTCGLIALTVAPLLGLWLWGRLERDRIEHRAAAVASVLAGRRVTVRCPGPFRRHFMYEINDGTVQFDAHGRPTDSTVLSASVCDGLKDALDRGPRLDLGCLAAAAGCDADRARVVRALVTLAHESMHLSGIANEGLAECQSNEHVVLVARRFGLTAAAAEDVRHWQRAVMDPQLPPSYQGC
jgi:hypothetical protein